jgi:CheY-like chemotaxis protein
MAEVMEKKRILYIEDDQFALDLVKRVLVNLFIVDLCDNAAQALELIKTTEYDGFLIDINLGRGMSGIQLLEQIKQMDKHINTPAIAITAYAAESDRKEFLAKGFTAYLSKPFAIHDLRKITESIFITSNESKPDEVLE